jgi:hypothetical protein
MTRNISIKLKAVFLLMVFSLNTVVGFACVLGVDMGFNSRHHHDEATEAIVHVHADGKKHPRQREAGGHQHKHKGDNHKSKDDNDDCCNDNVTTFSQLDKAVPQPSAVNPIFFTAIISSFYNIDILVASQVAKSTKYFVRGHHPPIANILIAIQRFQI